MKIIYIAGYGRSGSTIADIILSNRLCSYGLGEIANLPRRYKGENLLPVWSNCISHLKNNFNSADFKNVSASDSGILVKYSSVKYKKFWDEVFSSVQSQYPEKIDVFIDSSKTTWKTLFRPKKLYESGFEIFIVHLKRSYKDVFTSTLKGSNKSIKKNGTQKRNYSFAVKSLISCFLINTLTKMLYNKSKYNYKVEKYKDIINNTALFAEEVYARCGINYADDQEYLKRISSNNYETGNAFEGNRMRLNNNWIKIENG